MTYEGIYEKCNTFLELRMNHKEMQEKYPDPLSRWEQDKAYKARKEEIRNERREHCYG